MPKMTLNDLKTLRNELVEIHNSLGKLSKSSRTRNEEDGLLEIEVVDDEAEVGDTVLVAPIVDGEVVDTEPEVLGEIIEIVETADDEPAVEEVTENARKVRYQRIKNAKVTRNAKTGSYDVLVPITNAAPKVMPKATPKPKRYQVINRKSCNTDGGRTIDDMNAGATYTPAFPADQYAKITKNLARIDALIENTMGVKDKVKEEIDEALKETGVTQNVQQPKGKRYVRTKNYRTVKNSDGTLEVVIDASAATDIPDAELECFIPKPPADGNSTPLEDALAGATPAPPVAVDVILDGIPVASVASVDTTNKGTLPQPVQTNNEAFGYTASHPDLQPFLATNSDLQAMLALAQMCEYSDKAAPVQTDVGTVNAEMLENFGDAAPLVPPALFQK